MPLIPALGFIYQIYLFGSIYIGITARFFVKINKPILNR